jgi:two-component system chemotaxis sensor kinase CheA
MSELQEATREFLIEGHDNLNQLDADLVGLEASQSPGPALARIFRTLHTIKGSCSFLGFPHLQAVAHAGEDLLGKARDGKLALTPIVIETMLQMVDAIRRMLAEIEATGKDGDADDQSLLNLLRQLVVDEGMSAATPAPARPSVTTAITTTFTNPVAAAPAEVLSVPAGEPIPMETSAAADASVRIHVDLLDKLMAIAGEIVLARNQILQFSQRQEDPGFQNTCRQLNLITTELQEHVMKTRLLPLGHVWQRLPRLAHDAARDCGKKVRLETEGGETELDKTLLEAIRDPLTHLVRNAIDHGIEPPERRQAAGKPKEGLVRLRAYHESGQVIVEISDDGGGIDPQRITRQAIAQRLITSDDAATMSAQAISNLIFLPGFSTAAAVTTVSGRGVGMDVVKTNIEKIGGSVDVRSTVGDGTTVRLRIPLTLAIIKVLVVTTAGDRYAIPQVRVVELVRVEGDKARRSIQRVHGARVYRYRDLLLPLVDLNQVLEVEASQASVEDGVNIVVLQAADRQFGLVVDQINDTQEIVVKPLWKHLKSLSCFAGATVMGDGRVALILDIVGLAQRAGAVSDVDRRATGNTSQVAAPAQPRARVVLAELRDRARIAIPMNQVARLEEFAPSRVERVADRQVVQYDGQLLPLVDLDALRHQGSAPWTIDKDVLESDDGVHVVVYAGQSRQAGLVVRRILDVVEHDGEVQSLTLGQSTANTAVIQGHVTEVLDLDALIGAGTGG